MKEVKRVLVLEPDEYHILLLGLLHFRNFLIAEGKYTDAVDELILKLDKYRSRRRWFR